MPKQQRKNQRRVIEAVCTLFLAISLLAGKLQPPSLSTCPASKGSEKPALSPQQVTPTLLKSAGLQAWFRHVTMRSWQQSYGTQWDLPHLPHRLEGGGEATAEAIPRKVLSGM